jgi:hypothetical protein
MCDYNIHFKVQYYDIEQELLNKKQNEDKNKKLSNLEDEDEQEDEQEEEEELNNLEEDYENEEYEYSKEDILDICNKLYRDELLSVFGLDMLNINKLDDGMYHIYDIMMENEKFNKIMIEMIKVFDNLRVKQPSNFDKETLIKQTILITLFSPELFHITHKCICQQIESGTMNDDLLDVIRKNTVEIFTKQDE